MQEHDCEIPCLKLAGNRLEFIFLITSRHTNINHMYYIVLPRHLLQPVPYINIPFLSGFKCARVYKSSTKQKKKMQMTGKTKWKKKGRVGERQNGTLRACNNGRKGYERISANVFSLCRQGLLSALQGGGECRRFQLP